MESLSCFKRLVPIVVGLGTLVLAGCEASEGYTSEYPNGQPVYTNGQAYPGSYPAQYPNQVYPNGQPVYNGQVYSQYGQPAYAGQPMYGAADAQDYIYYPDSGVYYNPSAQLFVYRDGDHWEHRHDAPRSWRRNEAGVHVRIQGDPEAHDNEVRRQYHNGYRRDHDRDGD